jgi:L,D-transpeptidase catalytic domain
MVQVTQASSLFRPTCILLVNHRLGRLGSLPHESGRMPELCRFNCTPTLDFLRELRIKTLLEFMERFFLKLLYGVLSIGLVLFVTGCGEDPRFSANTQYLGGAYGGQQGGGGGPPRDTVSYWDGDHASGSPSIKISLGEQRAYFYKGGVLVGVSQLSTGREGLNTPIGNYKIIQKDKDHASTLFGDYVDSSGKVVVANIEVKKDPKPPGTHFQGTPMPYFMRIVSGTGLHAGYLPGYPASHGCIRMPEFMAEDFFRSVSVGTPVTITN